MHQNYSQTRKEPYYGRDIVTEYLSKAEYTGTLTERGPELCLHVSVKPLGAHEDV